VGTLETYLSSLTDQEYQELIEKAVEILIAEIKKS
jgi:hypothetical protein